MPERLCGWLQAIYEKMKWLEANDDGLRKLLLQEQRGYPAHCCNIIVPPTHPEAQAGYIILEQIEFPVMSGGNTISVVTVLLEMGMVLVQEPVTELVLEAPPASSVLKLNVRTAR